MKTKLKPVSKRQEALGFTMEKTVKMMRLTFNRLLLMHPEAGLTVDQWILINILNKYGSLSQQELGELTFKDAPTITRMMDLMAQKGMVTRLSDIKDRRKFVISLTESGERLYMLTETVAREFRSSAYDDISDDELEMLDSILKKIFDNLAKQN
jgi:DNA-binding MarR family transcriptional regulator